MLLYFKNWIIVIVTICFYVKSPGQEQVISEQGVFVDSVWSGHPVNFDLLTTKEYQYVVYYNSNRQMTVAQRKLNSKLWKKKQLPSITGWDSHNYITIEIDNDGFLHVSGNMHGDTLIYFRSANKESIDQFEQLPMTGKLETEVTYPVFFKDLKGNLYFQYRDGVSGKGVTIWNKYNLLTKKWERVFEGGLFDGENEANAYPYGPVTGTDGNFHLIWMWRQTPNANTNHNFSHMKSEDLIHWVNEFNDTIEIPVKWSNSKVFVDKTGPWNGLINMDFYIWFDNQNRPVITYHKYDDKGISQIYALRFENQNWKNYQLSHWNKYTWDLNKYGSIESEVNLKKMIFKKSEILAQFEHKSFGQGVWKLNNKDFSLIETQPGVDIILPEFIHKIKAKSPDYQKNFVFDNTGNYILLWQTLTRNQDRPRHESYFPSTALKVFEVGKDYTPATK